MSRVSYKRDGPGLNFFQEISAALLCFTKVSHKSKVIWYFFSFHCLLFDGVSFPYNLEFFNFFLLSKRFFFNLMFLFLRYFSFSIFLWQISVLYPGSIFWSVYNSFSLFANSMISMYITGLIFSWDSDNL